MASGIASEGLEVVVRVIDRKTGTASETRAFPSGPIADATLRLDAAVGAYHSAAVGVASEAGAAQTHWIHVTITPKSKVHVVGGNKVPGGKFVLASVHQDVGTLECGRCALEYSIGQRFVVSVIIGPRPLRLNAAAPAAYAPDGRTHHPRARGAV